MRCPRNWPIRMEKRQVPSSHPGNHSKTQHDWPDRLGNCRKNDSLCVTAWSHHSWERHQERLGVHPSHLLAREPASCCRAHTVHQEQPPVTFADTAHPYFPAHGPHVCTHTCTPLAQVWKYYIYGCCTPVMHTLWTLPCSHMSPCAPLPPIMLHTGQSGGSCFHAWGSQCHARPQQQWCRFAGHIWDKWCKRAGGAHNRVS